MKKGFTLVELSIVLVIIGLLIGGVLVGQSLISSAKIGRVIRDMQQYDVAAVQFYSKFRKYPGDSPIFAPPGNGNNVLDNTGCAGALDRQEYLQVWAHLSQSGMLSKTYASYSPTTTCPSGVHNATYEAAANGGIVWPYHEFSSARAISTYNQKIWPIWANKNIANSNFYFMLILDPVDTLAIENKLGAIADDVSTQIHVGVANIGNVGECFESDGSTVTLCSSNTAAVGALLFYVQPQ